MTELSKKQEEKLRIVLALLIQLGEELIVDKGDIDIRRNDLKRGGIIHLTFSHSGIKNTPASSAP